MKTILGSVLVFLWAVGLFVLRETLVRVEGLSRSSLPDIAWNWARPRSEKGKSIALVMGAWLFGYPVVVTLAWWALFWACKAHTSRALCR